MRDHEITQAALQKLVAVFEEAGAGAEAGQQARTAFDKIYDGQWARNILFGAAHDDTPERFGERVRNMAAHAIHLSAKDSRKALASPAPAAAA